MLAQWLMLGLPMCVEHPYGISATFAMAEAFAFSADFLQLMNELSIMLCPNEEFFFYNAIGNSTDELARIQQGVVNKAEGSFNRYGSEGPANHSRERSLTIVPAHTRISLAESGGSPVSMDTHGLPREHVVTEATDLDVLGIALAYVFQRRMGLPDECLHLVWGKLETTEGKGKVEYELAATVVMKSLDEATYDRLIDESYAAGRAVCKACLQPCHDADDDVPNSRHLNCIRCEPCMLCPRCRVYVNGKTPVCLLCLEEAELTTVIAEGNEREELRRRIIITT